MNATLKRRLKITGLLLLAALDAFMAVVRFLGVPDASGVVAPWERGLVSLFFCLAFLAMAWAHTLPTRKPPVV